MNIIEIKKTKIIYFYKKCGIKTEESIAARKMLIDLEKLKCTAHQQISIHFAKKAKEISCWEHRDQAKHFLEETAGQIFAKWLQMLSVGLAECRKEGTSWISKVRHCFGRGKKREESNHGQNAA